MQLHQTVRGVIVAPDGTSVLLHLPRGADTGLRALQQQVGGPVAELPIQYVGDSGVWGTVWFDEEAALHAAPQVSMFPSVIAPLFVLPVNVLFGPVVVLGPPTPDGDIEPIDDLVEQVIRRHTAAW